ncbi:DUF397 domain-containing protein [Actinomadura sp. KC345]|uniref:DUF397 domain-containing protein n=1 Tax=Actinomadura sp. KC345 TaxID=2530371 RepID=UPI001047AEF2|nr:DUF397 domain-containing protein [Actinomadura sp. KC345]TDC44666.1 DUF397 domain-containing protein [Actinomadura sp. KC345]
MSFDRTPLSRWRRSARCGASNGCVEVARMDVEAICVRDTEDTSAHLAFGLAEWRRFTEEARRGRFDGP